LANIVPPATAFTVTVNAAPRSVSNVSVSGTKVRLTLENRFTENSALLVNYTIFYGMYPGQHGYLEYRRYFSLSEGMEIAPYLKVGGGHSFQTSGSYGFGGIGVSYNGWNVVDDLLAPVECSPVASRVGSSEPRRCVAPLSFGAIISRRYSVNRLRRDILK
jgi:hypothetical protein